MNGLFPILLLQVCLAQPETKILPYTYPALLGQSVDIEGDRLVVGAPLQWSLGGLLGAVHVYEHQGGMWTLKALLADTQGSPLGFPYFGAAVSLDGDQVAVGVRNDIITASQSGSVFVFVKPTVNWVQEAKITAGEESLALGFAVDIEGDLLLIGSANPSGGGAASALGKAFIFQRMPGGWVKRAVFKPTFGPAEDRFGYAVALHGDLAFVGSPGNPITPWLSAGYVAVYRRVGKIWSLQQKLTPNDGQNGNFFGCSIDVHQDTLVVGSRTLFDPVSYVSGGAYVFNRSGDTWTQTAKLVPQGRTHSCNSGWSVAIDGATIALGAPSPFNTDGGALFLYRLIGKEWRESVKLAPYTGNSDGFGTSLALDGTGLAVGAPEDQTFFVGGAAYVYRISSSQPPPMFYCQGKKVAECSPRIFAVGQPSVGGAAAGDKHDVWAMEVRPQVKGMLVYSTSGSAQSPFAGGTLCVKAPIVRTALQTSTNYSTPTECHGYFKFDFSAWLASGADPALQAGRQVWLQYWYREPSFPAPNNVGLTGAMTALICQ